MKTLLTLPLLFVVLVVAVGCGKPVAHYRIYRDTGNSTPDPSHIEAKHINLLARQHAAEDHKQRRKSKKQTITYVTHKSQPYGLTMRIPSHRLTPYNLEEDSFRAFLYHYEYWTQTTQLEKSAIRPRVIALVGLACLAIGAIIVAESR